MNTTIWRMTPTPTTSCELVDVVTPTTLTMADVMTGAMPIRVMTDTRPSLGATTWRPRRCVGHSMSVPTTTNRTEALLGIAELK